MKKLWTVWKYAIGSFSDEQTEEYDNVVAIARTFIVGLNVVINGTVANVFNFLIVFVSKDIEGVVMVFVMFCIVLFIIFLFD